MTMTCLDCGCLTKGSRCATCQRAASASRDPMRPRGREGVQLRQRVIQRDRCCQRCGAQVLGVEYRIHHVIPVAHGGTHDLSNLILLCRQCHEAEHRANVPNSLTALVLTSAWTPPPSAPRKNEENKGRPDRAIQPGLKSIRRLPILAAMATVSHMFSYDYEVRDLAGSVVSTGQVTLDRAAQLGDDLGLNSLGAVVVDIYRSSDGGGRLILAPSPAY